MPGGLFCPGRVGRDGCGRFSGRHGGQAATERFDRLQEPAITPKRITSTAWRCRRLKLRRSTCTATSAASWDLEPEQGKRYSWGYPAIPDLADHARVFQLLPLESELGMSLTSAFQLVPEQSTAAIIVHHPQARYYTVGETRVEQLTWEDVGQHPYGCTDTLQCTRRGERRDGILSRSEGQVANLSDMM